MNRVKNSCVLFIVIAIFIILFVQKVPVPCPIKACIGISCPTCGMTRAMSAILHGDFITSIHYHILGIPVFISFIISVGWILYDIIRNKSTCLDTVFQFLEKYYWIVIGVAIFCMIINNIRGI